VIEPTAKAAAAATKSGKIGVLATKATVRRHAYEKSLGRLKDGLEVTSNGAPLLVPLVEEGWVEGDIPRQIVEYYLSPLRAAHVDTVVLGCTHYEYFQPVLRGILGDGVNLINTPHETAVELEKILRERGELSTSSKPGSVTIYSTDITDVLERVVSELFPDEAFPNQVSIQSAQIPPQIARGRSL
jgi:glutamate racemase